jgi:hypothetical protein
VPKKHETQVLSLFLHRSEQRRTAVTNEVPNLITQRSKVQILPPQRSESHR